MHIRKTYNKKNFTRNKIYKQNMFVIELLFAVVQLLL